MEIAPLPSPLDLLELPVFRTALLELGLLALAGGLLGAWIVLRRLAFFTHAAGTAAFPGLVVADAAGVSPRLAALVVGLGFAGGVERAGRPAGPPAPPPPCCWWPRSAIGTVLASDVFESGATVDRLLFGTAIGLGSADVAFSAVSAALAAAGTFALGRAWTRLRLRSGGVRRPRPARPPGRRPAAGRWWRSRPWPRSRRWGRCWWRPCS